MRLLRRRDEIITPPRDKRPQPPARGTEPARYAQPVPSRTKIAAALLLVAVALPIATAGAQRKVVTVQQSRHLWATVNVCDPTTPPPDIGPDTIGIRASMPGSRSGQEERYMRFVVHFFSRADDRWYRVAAGGDSDYLSIGKGRKARQFGRSFRIEPVAGQPVLLRGRVYFQWRVKGEVVRRASALTRKGHRSNTGDDPAGYSASTCTIT